MRRWLGLSLLLFLVAALPGAAAAQGTSRYFWIQAQDETGAAITSGVTCQVLTINTISTAPTIYSDASLATTQTNPITADGSGVCTWYGAYGTATYDVKVFHQRGVARLQALTEQDHRVVLNRFNPWKQIRFAYSATGAQGAVTNPGVSLPKGAAVMDVLVEVVTAGTGVTTMHVGLLASETGGDTDGFATAVSAATAGFIRPAVTVTAGTGTNSAYTANTRGVLLSDFVAGSDNCVSSTSCQRHTGLYREFPHLVTATSATSLVYQNYLTTGAGYVHIFYLEAGNR